MVSPERKVEMSQNTDHRILPKGAILAAIGLILAIVSAFYISAATAFFGIVLGGLAYARGGRRFAVLVVILSTIALFIGLFVGQSAVPGSYS